MRDRYVDKNIDSNILNLEEEQIKMNRSYEQKMKFSKNCVIWDVFNN